MMNGAINGTQVGMIQVLQVLGVVSFAFLTALGVVWGLKQIGGRMTADVQASIRKRGTSLTVSGTGLIGTYLAIVVFEFSGIYLVGRFFVR